ncbi:MAG: bifunctional tRNA (5-methylaminomethyl-2-thiouridine)(34)-methyltransferase MnmD/FAD-dependent 5-carboxymethylaminomethyl-2-thiouridine(34) oxidoreductase MnmC [Burkholderiales bacterium]|nr:bifunctional tRNA (5-methylaminomethyl-2-thiouridine)(34)-methyltransferase MnmD/FAD-dependent 5-carboxymethylaminomethyl-2-thiouridine(34) oxidoreductase MnmC [Burkholderiales bacterium]
MTIVPALPAFDASGTPYSPEYGDVYHSADSGPGQARHVFLGGNDLPGRWAGARVFTIVETGFGLGLNFLSTWSAWREDAARPERLHFVSVEKHPFLHDDLASLHARYPGFAPLARELRAAWPLPLPGLHRLEFEDGRVTLTLALGDAAQVLRNLRLAADAFYLDGFAPARNPEMWSPAIMKSLARFARQGATLATWSTSRVVRDALAAAGFSCELRAGFARKRRMLAARYAPRWRTRHAPPAAPAWSGRRAIVIGAGLAGAAVAERLAARGWRIDLIERHSTPAAEASGLPVGVFHPLLARDESVLARLTRAGCFHALGRWRALESAGHALDWRCCGLLQLARDPREESRMARTVAELRLPAAYAAFLSRDEGSARARCAVKAGGLWFPDGGWMRPASLVAAELAAARGRTPGLALHAGAEVTRIARDGEGWRAIGPDGSVIAAAPVCVLANAHDAARLCAFGGPALRRVRGQMTVLPAGSCGDLAAVLAGAAYLAPLADGVVAGASYDFDDGEPAPRVSDHIANLERLGQLLEATPRPDAPVLGGAVGFRCVARDRLPFIGSVADLGAARSRRAALSGAQPRDLPRQPGLYAAIAYGSRGLTWCCLGAELIAAHLEGEPPPLEADLADAVDPGRFVLQLVRENRGRTPIS